MGLNISGLRINKNYKDNLSDLESILDEKLVFEKDVTFEEASENWKEDTYCDIYYSDKGTLVFLAMEKSGIEFQTKKQTTFSFFLSEMTMTFSVNYVERGHLMRSIIEAESELVQNEGEPLEFEENEEDKSELIYHLFEKTLGESFHDIDLEAKCYRYTFKSAEKENNITEPRPTASPIATENKPWWKFW